MATGFARGTLPVLSHKYESLLLRLVLCTFAGDGLIVMRLVYEKCITVKHGGMRYML